MSAVSFAVLMNIFQGSSRKGQQLRPASLQMHQFAEQQWLGFVDNGGRLLVPTVFSHHQFLPQHILHPCLIRPPGASYRGEADTYQLSGYIFVEANQHTTVPNFTALFVLAPGTLPRVRRPRSWISPWADTISFTYYDVIGGRATHEVLLSDRVAVIPPASEWDEKGKERMRKLFWFLHLHFRHCRYWVPATICLMVVCRQPWHCVRVRDQPLFKDPYFATVGRLGLLDMSPSLQMMDSGGIWGSLIFGGSYLSSSGHVRGGIMQRRAFGQSVGSDKVTARRRLLWVGSCEGQSQGSSLPLVLLMVVLSRELSPRYWNATAIQSQMGV
ncbi:hypothetical protein B0T21DRAFT_424554 [Apiosordaria backusii]|uniref:Uncharacterized protein n=1 Tax=Apiosordaria backusii TaxID=314023 RepID=A0AA40AMR1_9PEZI|nr:hypothetical protein B0T21DRAFT_424554 [Apiosordaria backusii]